MNKKITFLTLKEKDIDDCIELFAKEYNRIDLYDRPDLQAKFTSEIPEMKMTTKEKIKSKEQYGYCLKNEQDKIIGCIIVTEPNYIRKLAIAEDYQHRGLARELVDMVRDRNEGKTLVVHAAEKVIPFYEKLGFELDGEMNRESFPYCPMKLSGREKQQEIIQEHSLFEK